MFDYKPIEERIPRIEGETYDEELPVRTQAVRLGVHARIILRARELGLDPYQADTLCVRGLGIHPAAVYGLEQWILADDIRKGEDGRPTKAGVALRPSTARSQTA